ncbi:MAG: ATP-dependent RNA helicase RhlB [Methylococcales bacterium]|nr:ATP-dependent RNA helicase RhlB [Methylococcales bacterium]MBT7411184.1 ATP-dependent RNA helicase RhlB [Methylococcales bacterium]
MIKNLFNKLLKSGKTTQPETKQQNQQATKPAKHKISQSKKNNSSAKNNQQNNSKKPKKKQQKPAQPSWDISEFNVPEINDKIRFHDLNLPDELMHAIFDLGFQYCSPIQGQILPHTLQGHDAFGKAQTGTGKTAAFLITIIDDLLKNTITEERYLAEPRALIIAPTRELVMQIAEDAKGLCKYSSLNVVTLFGGSDYRKQLNQVQKSFTDIVIATPGRLIDFMTRKDLFLDRIESLVLDEADRMLDMGFIPQVKRIVRATPSTDYRQTQCFSATFTNDIINLANQWTYKPVRIEIEPEHVATDTVEQKVYMVSNEEKLRVLFNILKHPDTKLTIIFTNRRDQSQHLYDKIRKTGIKTGILSGEFNQSKRTQALADFKSGKTQVMVATDVMGRGIHIDGISHVINYNLPDNPEDYVHRIGRTGRAGNTGTAISLACEFESFQLPAIEDLLGEKIKCELPPSELLK